MFKNFVQGFHLSVFITSALPAALLCLAVFWGLSTTHTFWRATESAIDGVRTIRHLHHALGDLQAIRSLRMQQLASPDPALAQQVQHLLQDFVLDFNDEYWPAARLARHRQPYPRCDRAGRPFDGHRPDASQRRGSAATP